MLETGKHFVRSARKQASKDNALSGAEFERLRGCDFAVGPQVALEALAVVFVFVCVRETSGVLARRDAVRVNLEAEAAVGKLAREKHSMAGALRVAGRWGCTGGVSAIQRLSNRHRAVPAVGVTAGTAVDGPGPGVAGYT